MRTYDVLDIALDRFILWEQAFDVRDESGRYVPLSEIDRFVAIVTGGDALDSTKVCDMQIQVLDDQNTKVRFFLPEATTASMEADEEAGFWFSYYVNKQGDTIPLLRGKVSVK